MSSMTHAEWQRSREIRDIAYSTCGKIAPVYEGPRSMFPKCGWEPDEELAKDLRALHPDLELVCDLYTRDPGESLDLGVHLYRYDRASGLLYLEHSLQWDMTKPYPDGKARPPGRWLLAFLRPLMKSHLEGTEEDIKQQLLEQRTAETKKVMAARDEREKEQAYIVADAVCCEMRTTESVRQKRKRKYETAGSVSR
jgi:hypothetical protein